MSWILIDLSWMIKTQESYELSLCRVLGFRGIFKGSAAQQARPAPLDRREMAKQIHDARQHLRFSPRFGRVDDSWWSGISWEMDSWLSLWTCCSFSGIRAAEWWTCDNCQCAFDSGKFDLIGEMVGPFESTDRPAHVNWLSWGVSNEVGGDESWRWPGGAFHVVLGREAVCQQNRNGEDADGKEYVCPRFSILAAEGKPLRETRIKEGDIFIRYLILPISGNKVHLLI